MLQCTKVSPIYRASQQLPSRYDAAKPSVKDRAMTKAAAKTADTIEFPTFDASKTADQFRAFAEKGAEQSKEAYAKIKSGAEAAQKAIESTFETARSAGSELSLKSIAVARTNAEAGFSHLEALAGAKS